MKSKFQVPVLALVFSAATASVSAAPVSINLGSISSISSNYTVPDLSFNIDLFQSQIIWYSFSIPLATGTTGLYFDIDLFSTGTSTQADTEIGLYNSLGNLVATDDDDGHQYRSALTFGNTTARTMPPDPFGFTNGVSANGRDGNLSASTTYYLAVGLFNSTFNLTNWSVTSTATRDPLPATINFRTDAVAVPEPTSQTLIGIGALSLVSTMIRRRRQTR